MTECQTGCVDCASITYFPLEYPNVCTNSKLLTCYEGFYSNSSNIAKPVTKLVDSDTVCFSFFLFSVFLFSQSLFRSVLALITIATRVSLLYFLPLLRFLVFIVYFFFFLNLCIYKKNKNFLFRRLHVLADPATGRFMQACPHVHVHL
jgi:hypothetical protein